MDFSFIDDPRWEELSSPEKDQFISYSFQKDMEADDRWSGLPVEEQKKMADYYFQQADEYRRGKEAKPERGILSTAGDILVSGAKGVIGAGEAAVGLADIPTLGRAGGFAEKYLGYDPEITQDFLSSLYSPAQKEANKRVEEATGFMQSAKAMIQNPSTIGHSIIESAPSMLGGAAAGRALLKTGAKLSPWVAAAIGEGLVGAGSSAEAIRQNTEDGFLTPKQSAISVVSGVGTGAFAIAGGSVAKKLGLADIDTLLVKSGSSVTPKGVVKRIVGGGITEGAFEELPQSMQEQIWQNSALDKPLLEGVPESAAKGLLTGMVMGGGANVIAQKKISDIGEAKTVSDAIKSFEEVSNQDIEQGILSQTSDEIYKSGVTPTEEEAKWEREIQKQRVVAAQAEALKKTPQYKAQQEIEALTAERTQVADMMTKGEFIEPEVLSRHPELVPKDKILEKKPIKRELAQKLDLMQSEVNESRTKGVTQEQAGREGETVPFPADSPRWMQDLQKERKADKKPALSRKNLNTLFDKVRNQEPLTDIQKSQYSYVERAIEKHQGETGEFKADERATELEKKGFDVYGGAEIPVSDLNQGDQVVATIDGVKDTYTVKGINEGGNRVFQDGVKREVHMFDNITIEGLKKSDPKEKGRLVREEREEAGRAVQEPETGKAAVEDIGVLQEEETGRVLGEVVEPKYQTKELKSIKDVKKKWDKKTSTLFLSENKEVVTVDSIIIQPSERKKGTGTGIMEDVVSYADSVGKRVELTPGVKDDAHGTTSRGRLVKFYKRFGFVENKGRNKDFAIGAGKMYRDPKDVKFQTKDKPKELATKLNKQFPGHDIRYDGAFDRTAIKKGPLYQFTPQSGKFAGRTFGIEELSVEAAEAKFEEVVGAKLQTKEADKWYSKMEQVLSQKLNNAPAKAMKDQVNAWARKGMFKQEELDWSGLVPWLESKTGKIAKQEVLDYLEANRVVVEDVVKGDMGLRPAQLERLRELEGRQYDLTPVEEQEYSELFDLQDVQPDEKETKFGQYQLPGGRNYKEILLSLPERREIRSFSVIKHDNEYLVKNDLSGEETARFHSREDAQELADNINRTYVKHGGIPVGNFKSPHFDEPNILAHIRMSEREVDGKKVLHISEIQSDWAQAGREKGFGGPLTGKDARRFAELLEMDVMSQAETDELGAFSRKQSGVPSTPFKKTGSWVMLTMKKLVRYAAENNFDTIAWDTGQIQIDRYWGNETVSAAVDRFNEITKPESVLKHAENIFGRKMAALMPLDIVDGGMLTSLQNDKVRGVVASNLPVDVVRILRAAKLSPDQVFSNDDVVIGAIPVNSRSRVAKGILSSLRETGATIRTKLSNLSLGGGEIEFFPTLRASDLNSREVASLLDPQRLFHLDGLPGPEKTTPTGSVAKSFPSEKGGVLGGKFGATKLAEFLNFHIEIIHDKEGIVKQGFEAPPGHGMKTFYDKILPSEIKKFFGKKAWGKPEIGSVDIFISDAYTNEDYAELDDLTRKIALEKGEMATIHALEITPEMKQKAITEGMPLFQTEKGKQDALRKTEKRDTTERKRESVEGQKAIETLEGIFQGHGDTSTIKLNSGKEQEAYSKISSLLELDTVLYESTDPGIDIINGVTLPGDNRVFVNVNSDSPIIPVVVHEMTHQLKSEHPDLYDTLMSEIKPNTKDFKGYADNLLAQRKEAGTGTLTEDEIFEEFVSDFAGDQSQRPEFWAKLEAKSPGIIKKVIGIINKIIAKIKRGTTRAEQYIVDLEKAQDALVTAMNDGLKRTDVKKRQSRKTRQTETKAFNNWFGDSKIVDEDGTPLVVYHGGPEFNIFDASKIGEQGRSEGAGFYFTPDKRIAKGYAGDVSNGEVKEVFLSIQKPIDFKQPAFGETTLKKILKSLSKLEAKDSGMSIADGFLSNFGDINYEGMDSVINGAVDLMINEDTALDQISGIVGSGVDPMIANQAVFDTTGHDGVRADGFSGAGGSTIYVAFFPTQIKSATENIKTFDPENPDIRYQAKVVNLEDSRKPISEEDYTKNRATSKSIKLSTVTNAKRFKDDVKRGIDKYLGAISTRLANINPKLRSKLRKLGFDTDTKSTKDILKVEPLLSKAKKSMTRIDMADWDYARKNSDIPKINELIDKYDMREEYDAYRTALNDLRDEGLDVGLDIGFIEEYAPRVLKDPRGFLKAIGKEGDWPVIERALKARAEELGMSVAQMPIDQKADLVGNMIVGGHYGLGGVPSTKERRLVKIPAELNKFYLDSDAALMSHIYSMRKAIEARRFFGKVPDYISVLKTRVNIANKKLVALRKEKNPDQDLIDMYRDNLAEYKSKINAYKYQRDYTQNISTFVMDLTEKGEIDDGQQQELIEILNARFHEKGTYGVIQAYKNLSYIDTMGSVTSALTQIGDLAWSAYEGGVMPTLKHAFKAATGKSRITKESVGIQRIAQEFQDAGTLGDAVSKVFKIVGLEKMDTIGKEALLNSALERYQKEAKKNPSKLKIKIRNIFEGETDGVIQDLLNDDITENVKLLVYNRLLDFQPVALSEMPQKYLDSGNGRLFYMLKSFTLKQFDVFRNEVFQKLKSKDKSVKLEGMKNFVRLSMFFVLANAGADELKDFVLGRKTDLSDRITDNILRLFGISKFVTWKARTEGVGTAAVKQILFPVKFIDALTKDIVKAGDDKGLETLASVPVVGKLAYWHMGRGTSKRGDLWDRRLSKEKKRLNKISDKSERDNDYRKKHTKDLIRLKRVNRLQGKLNRLRSKINRLKAREESKNINKLISKFETQRTKLITNFLKD